ncbi:MAG: flagellar basal body P-ring formation chaperone FlgA [Candidatus Igneacidithiobacillus chanchocoensis]
MRSFPRLLGLICLALTGVVPPAHAGENVATLRQAVSTFVRQHLPAGSQDSQVRVDVPASSISFPACSHMELGYFGYANPFGSQTVSAHCAAPQSWTLYVPVQVRQGSAIIIAAHSLSAGTILSAGDLRTSSADPGNLAGAPLSSPQEAIGQRLRYGVMAGQPILRSMLQARNLVHAGQQVTIVAEGDGIRIATIADAIEDGQMGQSILVRNIQSGRVLHAMVSGAGTVKVSF